MVLLTLLRNAVLALLAVLLRRPWRGPMRPSWSWRDEILINFNRRVADLKFPQLSGDALLRFMRSKRAFLERMSRLIPIQPGMDIAECQIAGIAAERVTPSDATGIVLYLHGGGYVICSPSTHRGLTQNIAAATGLPVLAIDYRLAPEHPCPAAVDDAVAAYRALLETRCPENIIIAGDSAGGGLAIATLITLRQLSLPMPAGVVALSPWVDLSADAHSHRLDTGVDLICAADFNVDAEPPVWYAGRLERTDPRVSPVFGDLRGLPPLLILAGGAEFLLADSQRLADRARLAGVDVTFHVEPDQVHVYPVVDSSHPRSQAAMQLIGSFVRTHLAPTSRSD